MQILGSNTNICFPKVLCVGVSLCMSVSTHVTVKVSHHLPSNIFKPRFKWLATYSNHTGSGGSSTGKSPNYFFRVIPTNWYSICRTFWHSIWHPLWQFYLACAARRSPLRSGSAHWALWCLRLRSGSAHWALVLAVRQCPLRSGARGWGLAVPTKIWSSRLRSGSAHLDLELAVEVRLRPLRSGARGWGPAVPTSIWSSRVRRWRRRWRTRRRRNVIKSYKI